MSHLCQRRPTIAIIGAGASGTLTAIHLLRRARRPLEVVLLDRSSRSGRGVAYGTTVEAHLLNVRAGNMSAFPDEPLHFFEWLRDAEIDRSWRAESPTAFVPRLVYGPYLDATMRAAQASARDGVVLDERHADVVGIAPDRCTLELRAPAVERERFLRHLQPYWDTHRHRVAQRIGQVVADTRASGQLTIWAGRLARFDAAPAGVRVEINGRRGASWTTEVARIINCTGPATNVERLGDPFIARLLVGGFARPDALHLGLETSTDGRLVDALGQPSQVLFSLGPVRRGELWETTSVPDIGVQAARLADVLVGELGGS